MAAKKSKVEDLLAQAPDISGAGSKAPKPIGVPADYVVTKPVQELSGYGPGSYGFRSEYSDQGPAMGAVPPKYYEGDELAPAGLGAEAIARLQRAMAAAGVLKGKYRIGVWDATSKNAYKSVLAVANSYGSSDAEALTMLADSPEVPDPEKERQPLTVKLSNPDDLAAVADSVARKTIGRKLKPEERQAFITSYQNAERGYQQSAYDLDPTGGTVTAPPDPSTMAETMVRQQAPGEAAATDFSAQANEFFDLLGGR